VRLPVCRAGDTERLGLDCLAVAKRGNQQVTVGAVAPSSAAYREAHARPLEREAAVQKAPAICLPST